jgi:hypothetical protein
MPIAVSPKAAGLSVRLVAVVARNIGSLPTPGTKRRRGFAEKSRPFAGITRIRFEGFGHRPSQLFSEHPWNEVSIAATIVGGKRILGSS